MHAELAAQLSPGARKHLGGTDLEYNTDRLEQLAEVVPDEQEAVVRAHVNLRVPWSDALAGRTLRSAAAPIPEVRPQEVPTHRIERRKVANLNPNRFNAALFPDSLSEASIAVLAEDLARNGQRVPGEVTPDGTIIDCERRWRAAKQLGWEELDVTVVDGLTDDDILDRVLDSCTSARQMSIREQVNVFTAVFERLKREAGREAGRPNQIIPKGIVYVTPDGIRDAAAKRAGFSSATLAMRAEAVFSRGSGDLQAKVRDGSVSITAAYDQVPKRPKSKRAESTTEDEPAEDDVSPIADPEQAASTSSGTFAPVPTSPSTDPEDEGEPAGHDDTNDTVEDAACPAGGTAEPTEEGEPEAADEELDEAEGDLFGDSVEDEPDIGLHVSAVCQHLSQLAEQNYEDAIAWFNQTVDEMRASIGEPPDVEAEGEFGE